MHVMMTANAAWNIWNFRRGVASALIAGGHRVSVLAPCDQSTTALEAMGCRVIDIAVDAMGVNPLAELRLISRFRTIFRQEKPDVILSYTIKNNVYGGIAARLTGLPFIPNVSGLGTAFLAGGALQRVAETLSRLAFRRLPVVFFQNPDDRGLFLARRIVTQAQAHLLPGSGIDLQHFAPAPYPSESSGTTFLMIARLLKDKGVLEFVAAARALRRDDPGLRFQILGAADALNRSAIDQETLASWRAEGVIEHLGTADDVRPAIAAADCVVLPSYREGAPRTLIEASAMARPIIATDVPGCRAVVDAGVTGFLCQPKSADSLASVMRRFLALPRQQRIAMGRAARGRMERHFDERIVIDAYRNAIACVTGKA